MEIFTVFSNVFGFLGQIELFGVPFIYLLLGTSIVGLIMNFIKGIRK